MTFAVVWMPPALAQLADIWTGSPDRAPVTAASHRIDRALSRDPVGVGESRDGADRILFEPPLAVYYRIILDDRRVEVIEVGTMKH